MDCEASDLNPTRLLGLQKVPDLTKYVAMKHHAKKRPQAKKQRCSLDTRKPPMESSTESSTNSTKQTGLEKRNFRLKKTTGRGAEVKSILAAAFQKRCFVIASALLRCAVQCFEVRS